MGFRWEDPNQTARESLSTFRNVISGCYVLHEDIWKPRPTLTLSDPIYQIVRFVVLLTFSSSRVVLSSAGVRRTGIPSVHFQSTIHQQNLGRGEPRSKDNALPGLSGSLKCLHEIVFFFHLLTSIQWIPSTYPCHPRVCLPGGGFCWWPQLIRYYRLH